MKKTFNKNNKNKYLQEIELFKQYPDYILPINNYYESESHFIIEYNNPNLFSGELNKESIDRICKFFKLLQENNIDLDYFDYQTIFIKDSKILFSLNNSNFEHINVNNSIFLDKELYLDDYSLRNNIYMLGIYFYQKYYNKMPNFSKLCKKTKKPFFKFSNTNYFSSYINRILELCLFQKKDPKIIIDLILKENVHKNITHRLYFVDEVSNALYFSIYEGNIRDALYWGSELFGVGEYNLIIKEIIKILILKIGILYKDLYKYIFYKIINFNKNSNRYKKEILVELLSLLCSLKKNSIIENLLYLSYEKLIQDDLNIGLKINNIFSGLEIDMVKFIRIFQLQNKTEIVWKYLLNKNYNNYKYMYYFKKFNADIIFLAAVDFYRNQYIYFDIPEIKINSNILKYFGFNLNRNKNNISQSYLNFDTIRGNPDIIRKNEYYGCDRYKEFNDLNIINYFSDDEIILNFGYRRFSMKQIYNIYQEIIKIDLKLENDYLTECFNYLYNIENSTNFIYTTLPYIHCKAISSQNYATDKYNLLLLDQI